MVHHLEAIKYRQIQLRHPTGDIPPCIFLVDPNHVYRYPERRWASLCFLGELPTCEDLLNLPLLLKYSNMKPHFGGLKLITCVDATISPSQPPREYSGSIAHFNRVEPEGDRCLFFVAVTEIDIEFTEEWYYQHYSTTDRSC